MPKYFYDDLGSALFETITRLPEYYLTRIERDLLATYGSEIVAAFDEPLELLELGSGSATKTRVIIDAILERQDELTFHPIDISPDALVESSEALVAANERAARARVRRRLLRRAALAPRRDARPRARALPRLERRQLRAGRGRELFGLLGGAGSTRATAC